MYNERPRETAKLLSHLDEQGQAVLQASKEEAERFNHNYIGTEHILLGLTSDETTKIILERFGVDTKKVRDAIGFIIGRGDKTLIEGFGLTPRSIKVLALSWDECLRESSAKITPLFLLRGLLREGEGIAAGILESLGIHLEKVRRATIEVPSSAQEQIEVKDPLADYRNRIMARLTSALDTPTLDNGKKYALLRIVDGAVQLLDSNTPQ